VDVSSLRNDLVFFKGEGLVNGNVVVEQVIDNSFAAAAVKELGPYKKKK
jgi:NitT/TauT family transport system substrate-binding protein